VRTASVRFYFDADILGLGKLIANVRADVTYPGDPGAVLHKRRRLACPITSPHTEDTAWIPVVAQAGWVTITRDRHIQDHRAELAAVRENRLRMVALSAPEARTTWEQLEVVMCQWRAIEALADSEGPLLCLATRTSFRPISLQ
jgi:PIN like domain